VPENFQPLNVIAAAEQVIQGADTLIQLWGEVFKLSPSTSWSHDWTSITCIPLLFFFVVIF